MAWVWYLVWYSFLGFLLEVAYARLVGEKGARKGMLLLPLCPVYGVGACAVLGLAPLGGEDPLRVLVMGGTAATAAEYGMAVWYERVLGVRFWDYRGVPGNLQGRVCLPFSAAWGVLSLGLVYWVHPWTRMWAEGIPAGVSATVLAAAAADFLVSSLMMYRTGGRACLRWYG